MVFLKKIISIILLVTFLTVGVGQHVVVASPITWIGLVFGIFNTFREPNVQVKAEMVPAVTMFIGSSPVFAMDFPAGEKVIWLNQQAVNTYKPTLVIRSGVIGDGTGEVEWFAVKINGVIFQKILAPVNGGWEITINSDQLPLGSNNLEIVADSSECNDKLDPKTIIQVNIVDQSFINSDSAKNYQDRANKAENGMYQVIQPKDENGSVQNNNNNVVPSGNLSFLEETRTIDGQQIKLKEYNSLIVFSGVPVDYYVKIDGFQETKFSCNVPIGDKFIGLPNLDFIKSKTDIFVNGGKIEYIPGKQLLVELVTDTKGAEGK